MKFKLYITSNIRRILEMIEQTYKRRKVPLEDFKKFRRSLENGSNNLLFYEEGQADMAKIRLMEEIKKYYTSMPRREVYRMIHRVEIERGLISRLTQLKKLPNTKAEATKLLTFINAAQFSCWGQIDEKIEMRFFKLVTSREKFEELLKFPNIEELTQSPNQPVPFTTIRLAIKLIDYDTLYRNNGIYEDYIECLKRHSSNPNPAIEMFNFWHGVMNTAVFYIYPGDD